MKNIITILLFCLSIGVMAQDIQLDSITYFYNNGDLTIQESFEYQNGLLSKRTYDNFEFSLVYDDQQNLIAYEELKFGILQEKRNLDYNDDNQLVYVEILKDNEISRVFELNYVDNKLGEIEQKININGQLVAFRLQKYSYENNLIRTDYFSGSTSNLHSLVITEEYDDQGRLIKKAKEWLVNSNYTVDSLIYKANGDLDRIFEIDYSAPLDIQTHVKTFTSDSSKSFTDILSPAAFYETLKVISNYNSINTDQYGIFYGNKIDFISTDDGSTTWSYSILSSNQNERIPALPISVFPNPTQEFIKIESEIMMEFFEIYDMNGSLIRQESITSNIIDVSNLTSGNFIIVYSDIDDQYYFAQFLKQ